MDCAKSLRPGNSMLLFNKGKSAGGHARNRTGVHGFAVRCVTTPPRGQPNGIHIGVQSLAQGRNVDSDKNSETGSTAFLKRVFAMPVSPASGISRSNRQTGVDTQHAVDPLHIRKVPANRSVYPDHEGHVSADPTHSRLGDDRDPAPEPLCRPRSQQPSRSRDRLPVRVSRASPRSHP